MRLVIRVRARPCPRGAVPLGPTRTHGGCPDIVPVDGRPCSGGDHNSKSTMADPSAIQQEDTKNSTWIDSRIARVWL
eukprot:366348-Rhodomonas_salina.1